MVFNPEEVEKPVNVMIECMQISAAEANVTSKQVMRSFVYKSIVEPRLKSSQVLRAELDNYKRARANNIVDNSSSNPSTVSGLAVRQHVIDQSREADANRVLKAAEAVKRKEEGEAKRVEMRARREEAWVTVSTAADLNLLTVAVLKVAAQRCRVIGAAKLKKQELIAALEPFTQSLQQLPDLDNVDDEVEDLGVEARLADDCVIFDEFME